MKAVLKTTHSITLPLFVDWRGCYGPYLESGLGGIALLVEVSVGLRGVGWYSGGLWGLVGGRPPSCGWPAPIQRGARPSPAGMGGFSGSDRVNRGGKGIGVGVLMGGFLLPFPYGEVRNVP